MRAGRARCPPLQAVELHTRQPATRTAARPKRSAQAPNETSAPNPLLTRPNPRAIHPQNDGRPLQIQVCHFPPGTSKWNKIEHRLFSFITHNWRGKPLVTLEVIINLIATTSTRTGLEVYAQLDKRTYPDKVKVPDTELAAVQLTGATFHPEWNCTIKPHT
jgi:hypothetical protein